jgi:hypothetical protein
VSQRNEAQSSTYARLAYEHTSGLPLHLTYLKPEAARSLFPRLIDRNVQPIIFRASPGCNEVIYSCRTEHRAPGCALANRGAQANPPHKNARSKTAHLAFRRDRRRIHAVGERGYARGGGAAALPAADLSLDRSSDRQGDARNPRIIWPACCMMSDMKFRGRHFRCSVFEAPAWNRRSLVC